jgi:hypothetical protein
MDDGHANEKDFAHVQRFAGAGNLTLDDMAYSQVHDTADANWEAPSQRSRSTWLVHIWLARDDVILLGFTFL